MAFLCKAVACQKSERCSTFTREGSSVTMVTPSGLQLMTICIVEFEGFCDFGAFRFFLTVRISITMKSTIIITRTKSITTKSIMHWFYDCKDIKILHIT